MELELKRALLEATKLAESYLCSHQKRRTFGLRLGMRLIMGPFVQSSYLCEAGFLPPTARIA